ncbi:MAG: hypothetical protein HPY50_04185 [Firmicutes bacterium]|nr:hypothetical protein [Bacillota bacterium]
MKKCRELNLALSVSEFNQGSACVSLPVRDFSQKVVAVLSVAFPEKKAVTDNFQNYYDELRKAVRDISGNLGYRENNNKERREYLRDCYEMEQFMKELYRSEEGGERNIIWTSYFLTRRQLNA